MNERNDMQPKLGTIDRRHTILIIGIWRGIARGLAAEYLRRGWFIPSHRLVVSCRTSPAVFGSRLDPHADRNAKTR
jgi:hypothetical protein